MANGRRPVSKCDLNVFLVHILSFWSVGRLTWVRLEATHMPLYTDNPGWCEVLIFSTLCCGKKQPGIVERGPKRYQCKQRYLFVFCFVFFAQCPKRYLLTFWTRTARYNKRPVLPIVFIWESNPLPPTLLKNKRAFLQLLLFNPTLFPMCNFRQVRLEWLWEFAFPCHSPEPLN